MAVKITCITKDNGNHMNPHEAITNLGWVNEETRAIGTSTREQMIEFIEKQGGSAYTRDGYGGVAYLIVKTSSYENKYVKTIADGVESDNLLFLAEC
jgi:hypothetical protein